MYYFPRLPVSPSSPSPRLTVFTVSPSQLHLPLNFLSRVSKSWSEDGELPRSGPRTGSLVSCRPGPFCPVSDVWWCIFSVALKRIPLNLPGSSAGGDELHGVFDRRQVAEYFRGPLLTINDGRSRKLKACPYDHNLVGTGYGGGWCWNRLWREGSKGLEQEGVGSGYGGKVARRVF